MAPLSYRERVQDVLSVLAGTDGTSIVYDGFIDRVQDMIRLDLRKVGPQSKTHIERALMRERLARRLKCEPGNAGHAMTIRLTAEGLHFYRYNGLLTLHTKDRNRFERLTLKELRRAQKALRAVLNELKNVISTKYARFSPLQSFEEIPAVAAQIVARVTRLGEQHTELLAILAENSTTRRSLL
ncbi:hypothetical protein BV20DRAFT_1054668 [Pilatotrama ljubarskyi]|nr:hypothetical protein BV20DRAFT_1054668 [Pilatotrama ljubarskyi]